MSFYRSDGNHAMATEVWEALGDIAIDDEECIDTPFLHFPAGTHREEIWHWIEETYDVSVHNLMFSKEAQI